MSLQSPETITITLTQSDDEWSAVARWTRDDGYLEDVHASGDTMHEALENIHAAIQLALED